MALDDDDFESLVCVIVGLGLERCGHALAMCSGLVNIHWSQQLTD